jgi:hypothetical protein
MLKVMMVSSEVINRPVRAVVLPLPSLSFVMPLIPNHLSIPAPSHRPSLKPRYATLGQYHHRRLDFGRDIIARPGLRGVIW